MNNIEAITLDVTDTAAAKAFYDKAFGLGDTLRFRQSDAPSTGFRGYILSIVTAQPGNVSAFVDAAVAAGATVLKPITKSMWGYAGVLQAPDGSIWKVACSAKKDTAPISRTVDDLVILLGVADMAAAKKSYVEHGVTVAKSFPGMYVEFASGAWKLALYKHKALAKEGGVAAEGTGSHRIALTGTGPSFTDPDGYAWQSTESVSPTA